MMTTQNKKLILRIQSEDGIRRLEMTDRQTLTDLLRITHNIAVDGSTWRLFKDRKKNTNTQIFQGLMTMRQAGLRHGDMLYLDLLPGCRMDIQEPGVSSLEMARRRTNSSMNNFSNVAQELTGPETPKASESAPAAEVVEDEVDQILGQQDGTVQRPKDERLCRHGPTGKCIYCMPIDPFDEEYLQSREPPIKHMSFHAYMRKLTNNVNKGKFAILQEASCRIKPGCTAHLPWPDGICTKCQPSAITLNRQRYRHVDNVMFENPDLVERFLDYWRRTGLQRIGYLYGKYEPFKDVPLGIRATVSAIYEPPQISTENSIELREDPNSEVVDCVALKMGLRRVGWIFTDLLAEDVRTGTVRYLRNKDTYFLTAEECITAAFLQVQNSNPCKLSPNGQFGSKFVTVVVTGDQTSQIHFEGYQVSDQCMALVRDNCLVPTFDVPEFAYVKESSSQQYVPDVFYKEKDEYGNEVTRLARPLPVEYLIVDVPASMPKEAQYTFKIPAGKQLFPVENRLDQVQNIHALWKYVSQFPKNRFLDAVSDFHVLIFMATTDTITLQDEDLDVLVAAISSKDSEVAEAWATTSEYWQAIAQSGAIENGARGSARANEQGTSSAATVSGWTCKHCTFINTNGGGGSCEMCGLPL